MKNDFNKSFDFLGMSNSEIEKIKKKYAWALTTNELKIAQKRTKRPMMLTEVYILDSLWSDHCSYKHSKNKLKQLIRKNKYVLESEKSDAGAVCLPGSNYAIVFKIESHNHPTLINPEDGAATGVGGIIRDIFAMGAKNLGVGGSLRYGPKTSQDEILSGAMKGAAEYNQTMKLPLIDSDIYYDETFAHNCLMNVSALGVINKKEIIPNIVSPDAVGYNLIYFGKPTAGAGFGGASFASQAFEEGVKKEIEFGSNPNLERATFIVFEKVKNRLKKKGLFKYISLKDMGAAGLTCSTVEQTAPKNLGVEIYLNKVPIPKGKKVTPAELAVGEDQERNMLIAPKGEATRIILNLFNQDKEFKKAGGKAVVIGKVIEKDKFILRDKENIYCDLPASLITNAPVYKPKSMPPKHKIVKQFQVKKPTDLKKTILDLLNSKNIRSKKDIFKMFEMKKGVTHIINKASQTDVCIIAPLIKEREASQKEKNIGIGLVFGGKSIQGRNGTPKEQAFLATVSGRLKLAVSGLKPIAVADGCNYGDPENSEHYYCFSQGINGLNKACQIPIYNEPKEPMAVVSGNVSLKNTYISGGKEKPIDPSLIPAVLGYIEDYHQAVTIKLKEPGNNLYLVGKRKHQFKGSEYAKINNQLGKNLPMIKEKMVEKLEYSIIDAIHQGLIKSAKTIENGGLIAALAKMMQESKNIGVELKIESFANGLREDYVLFSESIGYIIEVEKNKGKKLEKLYKKYALELTPIGRTTNIRTIAAYRKDKKLFEIPVSR